MQIARSQKHFEIDEKSHINWPTKQFIELYSESELAQDDLYCIANSEDAHLQVADLIENELHTVMSSAKGLSCTFALLESWYIHAIDTLPWIWIYASWQFQLKELPEDCDCFANEIYQILLSVESLDFRSSEDMQQYVKMWIMRWLQNGSLRGITTLSPLSKIGWFVFQTYCSALDMKQIISHFK